jgi:hypothetical protein
MSAVVDCSPAGQPGADRATSSMRDLATGAPGWLLQSLQAEEVEHTCGRATTGAAEQQTVEAGGVGQPTAPEGSLAPRPARSGGRPGSANTDVQSRCCWSSQSSQCMDCAACRVEWIREYDKSQHISRPTADAAIAASRRAVERDRWGRCTRAYQLLALAAISHRRLGADTASALFRLPFDLHEKVASFSRVPTEHVADRFVEDEGWAWARTATLSMQAKFDLGATKNMTTECTECTPRHSRHKRTVRRAHRQRKQLQGQPAAITQLTDKPNVTPAHE